MPSSSPDVIEKPLRWIIDECPMSILDCGVGFGKWGHLAREYLELIYTKAYRKEDWKVIIDGIEGFPPYIQVHQVAIYNNIYLENLNDSKTLDWLSKSNYDLYLAMDILEHLDDYMAFLQAIPKRAGIVALTPLGHYPQGAVFGNDFEIHKHAINIEDLDSFFPTVEGMFGKILCFRSRKR